MSPSTDETHDPERRSWVASANGHGDFPIQNLPLGIFSPAGGEPRGGIAIGDMILDLGKLAASAAIDEKVRAACALCADTTLNGLLASPAETRRSLRLAVGALLDEAAPTRHDLLHAAGHCIMHLPARIGDYTDFYAGIHHATNVGRLFRPDNPLPLNYKYVPIGYHGRASSVRVSGTPFRRPNGQTRPPDRPEPEFGPTARLDFELELGIWAGPGNAPGSPIAIADAAAHIAGYCLLNDWSARDIQTWEYQPLGPFLAKSFCTSISPWIVTPEALLPFRRAQQPRPEGDPALLPYLTDAADQSFGALGLTLSAFLVTAAMREQGVPPHRLSQVEATELYWTPAQLLTHHASNGCDLRPGDLLGSGTISSQSPAAVGSLLEATSGGRTPIALPSGESRLFLEDGDEVILRGHASRVGFTTIGFGECRAIVLPAAPRAGLSGGQPAPHMSSPA